MISAAITLPMVEGLIASRKPFPPAIKEQFERDSRERHARRLKIQMLAAAIVYNAVLPADLILVPDVGQVSAAIHWLIVTPLMIAAAFAMPRLSPRVAREIVAAAIATAMCLQYLFVFLATQSQHAGHYQYFVLLVMVFPSMTLRPSFRIYLLVASFVFVLHTIAVHFLSELTWQDGSMGSLVLGIGIYVMTAASAVPIFPAAREPAAGRGRPFQPL